nr:hypothetical protein [Tanacetum cinerariifolium]
MSLTGDEKEEAARRVHATHERLVTESDEPFGEPANMPTGRRRPSSIAVRDTSNVSAKKPLDQTQKLKDIQVLTKEEQLAADTMQAIKANKMVSRSQPHTEGSSEEAVRIPEVLNESIVIFITSSEKTGITPGVLDEIQSPSLLKVQVSVIPEQTTLTISLVLSTVTPILMVPLPPPIVSTISSVQQQITPIPTPPITTIAPSVTTTFPDPLLAIIQRVSELKKDVKELKQVDHSLVILAIIRSHVPLAVNEYLGSSLEDALQKILQKHTKELIQQSSQKDVYEIIKIKQVHATKEKMPNS